MSLQKIIKDFYLDHRIQNPVNFTLTQKQIVNGDILTDITSEQNFRHFSNVLNSKCLGVKYKRYGQKLAMFVVREHDLSHRHHIHCAIERPEHLTLPEFVLIVRNCWVSTRFGYHQIHFESPQTEQREFGWIDYCLKKKTKAEYSSSIDWSNSTCFELS